MKYYIGIDLGGTKVRVAKVDEEGKIVEEYSDFSHGLEGPRELILNTIISLIDKIDNVKGCEGIGIAVPGPVDVYNMVMPMAVNLVGFKDYPFAKIIEEKYQIPVYLDNDANMAGLAEAVLGAGKGKPIVYYLTHSTGIGGALIINGKVVSGQMGYAGEIANIIVKDNCKKINENLNAGAVEAESSGTALARKASELYGETTSTKTLFENARKGDLKAQALIDEAAKNMGRLLATIGQIVDPHIFVIGGGVSKDSDLYWPKMIETYHELFNGIKPALVTKAELKEPGVLGAAMLVKEGGNV